ncbi:MAG: flagellar hook-associated protein FlgL [Desulfobacterales bacterium]|nr:flagellar hook-associated protein FlgL [Desulfobacterales bacterium]
MRVANRTIYDIVKFNLANITEELYKANKVVASGKRVIDLSDDPVGLTQALNIKSSLSNIEQLDRNITVGESWLTASDSALMQVQNLISDTKTLCVQMATETLTAAQRKTVIETVKNNLDEIVSLANIEVGGRYVFAGSKTDAAPVYYADANGNPVNDPASATQVLYDGDDNPFAIKISRDTTIQVGQDGDKVFWDDTITIDATNNKIDFIEYTGGTPDSELTATVQSGTYTHSELAIDISSAMNAASDVNYVVTYNNTTEKFTIQDDGTNSDFSVDLLWNTGTNAKKSIASEIGFDAVNATYVPATSDSEGVKYAIDDSNNMIDFIEVGIGGAELNAAIILGDYTGDDLAIQIKAAMELAGGGATYTVSYDSAAKEFSISGAGGGLTQLQLLWNTGNNGPGGTGTSAATVLGFDDTANDAGSTDYTSDSAAKIEIITDVNDKIDFKELPNGGSLSDELTATIASGTYTHSELATAIKNAMNTISDVDYEVTYDSTTNKITITEDGTALDELHLLWETGTNGSDKLDISAAGVLGFDDADDDTATFTYSDNEARWGIFPTLINLKNYLQTNDVAGISKSITKLGDHFDHISSTISDMGSKMLRMEIKKTILQEMDITNTDRLSKIEDADITDAIMDLKMREVAYQAALAAAVRVLNLSLVDYLR